MMGDLEKGKKFQVQECVRMDSLNCVSQPQEKALVYIRRKDLQGFTDFINTQEAEAGSKNTEHWMNLPVEDGANLVEITVREGHKAELTALLKVGARMDLVGEGSGLTPLHVAVEAGQTGILKLLINARDDVDINIPCSGFKGGYSPLHLAAESVDRLQALQLLLQVDEIDVDAKDVRGVQTPLAIAVKAKNQHAAKLLIEHGASLDHKVGPKTLREHISTSLPYLDVNSIKVKQSRDLILNLEDKIFTLIKATELNTLSYQANFGQFKTYLRFFRKLKSTDLKKIFEICCKKGLWEHLQVLLEKGANPNCSPNGVLEAAFYGHHMVLQVLKKFNASFSMAKAEEKETILHVVMKMEYEKGRKENYAKCLQVLAADKQDSVYKQMCMLVNKPDGLGCTPLHYATQLWDQTVVRQILEMGANIGIKNHWGELPISRIRPDTMESFLDEFCLTSSGDVVQEDFHITFRYDFLAPHRDALPEKYQPKEDDPEENLLAEKNAAICPALPETEPLWYMSNSKEHRHLLKHPVITSFLWFKWARIRKYFNRNLRFFLLFVFLLTWYVFNTFGSYSRAHTTNLNWYFTFIVFFVIIVVFIIRDWIKDYIDLQWEDHKIISSDRPDRPCVKLCRTLLGNWIEVLMIVFMTGILVLGNILLEVGLTGLLVLLVLREILQMTVSMKRYFFSMENLVEITIIAFTFVILFDKRPESFELNRHLGAIVIILSWAELIVLVGVHPKLKHCNIYVTIFLKVIKTFFWFLAWYSMFIVAFGFGFYIILHTDVADPKPAEDDPYVFFNQTWLSVVKTTTMFVGELEFSDLPIDLDSPLAPLTYLFFLSFLFLIVVVLMNLLNGLAVSDTGIIREKAEIFSYRSRVETISTLESMLLGDPFDFLSNVPKLLSSMPSCSLVRQLYRNRLLSNIFKKIGSSEILLFYKYLPNKQITISPNQYKTTCCTYRIDEMGRDIIRAAKQVVLKKKEKEREAVENKEVEYKIDQLNKKVASLESKLDFIISKLK